MQNIDIRFKAKSLGVPLWKVAKAMNIGTNTLYTRLRKELSAEEKSLYFATIHKIAQDQVQTVQKSLNTNANTGTMTCQAKRARAAYYRDWRKKNPGKASEYQKRYWERKYQKNKSEENFIKED